MTQDAGTRPSRTLVLLLLCWPAGEAFAQETSQRAAEPDTQPQPAAQVAPPEREQDAPAAPTEATGILTGVVRFAGEQIPSSTIVPVGADPHYCGHEHSKQDCVIDPESRGIRYVIVRLAGEQIRDWPPSKPGYLRLDNSNCRFEPHAAVLTRGSTIEAYNSDEILHTVHAYFAASFNVALPRKGVSVRRVVSAPGLIQFRCDVHGWMNAFVQVDPHPFHAVTDTRGRFTIAEVPGGSYTLVAWHERLGTQEAEIRVEPGQRTEVELNYRE